MRNKMNIIKKVNVDNCSSCDKWGIMTEWKDLILCVHCARASVNWA
jgi:hypothetical protein